MHVLVSVLVEMVGLAPPPPPTLLWIEVHDLGTKCIHIDKMIFCCTLCMSYVPVYVPVYVHIVCVNDV